MNMESNEGGIQLYKKKKRTKNEEYRLKGKTK
jgi:hypothetical protein